MDQKTDNKKVPGGTYQAPDKNDAHADDCNQCFYTPNASKDTKRNADDDCNQCFYPVADESQKVKEEDDCNSCFYKPKNPGK